MKLIFDNKQELDKYVNKEVSKSHQEWSTNFDKAISAIIEDKSNLVLLQYYTQTGGDIDTFIKSHRANEIKP